MVIVAVGDEVTVLIMLDTIGVASQEKKQIGEVMQNIGMQMQVLLGGEFDKHLQ